MPVHNPASRHVSSANDNAPGTTCAGEPPPRRTCSSISSDELEILQPLIKALAQMAANDLCATTLCSGDL